MKFAVLDTNFILSCIRKKIDFFDEISLMGMKVIVPNEVIKELDKMLINGKKELQAEARIALVILDRNSNSFEKVNLNPKNTDNGIVSLARRNRNLIIATLDKEIRSKIQNKAMVIRGEKKLEII